MKDPMIHRLQVTKRDRLWWWHCHTCEDHFGYGRQWARVFRSAERHALGRRLR